MSTTHPLLLQPEGKTQEFKRDLSSPQNLLKTLVAFANSAGGRLVIGVDDARRVVGDCAELKAWCQQQAQGRRSIADIRAQLAAQREKAAAEKVRLQAEAQDKAAKQEAERQQEAARAQALAAMTAQLQTIETLRQACADWAAKLPPNGNFKKQAADANKPGLYQDAVRLVKTAQESADWSAADRAALADMLEGSLPAVIAGWDAKEQRKKLQWAKLRGTA